MNDAFLIYFTFSVTWKGGAYGSVCRMDLCQFRKGDIEWGRHSYNSSKFIQVSTYRDIIKRSHTVLLADSIFNNLFRSLKWSI